MGLKKGPKGQLRPNLDFIFKFNIRLVNYYENKGQIGHGHGTDCMTTMNIVKCLIL